MPRTRDVEAQRRDLSEAVWQVLADRGAPGLTLRAVAERAGCTTGLVLHTFRDKRALLLHARDLLHERTRTRMDASERSAFGPADALRAIVLDALPVDEQRLANSRVWIGFLAAALADQKLAERHAAHNAAFRERLTGLLRRAAPSASDTAARVGALAGAVEGISALAAADPASWPVAAQVSAAEVVLRAAMSDEPSSVGAGLGDD